MCFVGVPADSMKDMYTLSPGTAHASLSTCNSIMGAGTTGAVAVATGRRHAEADSTATCEGDRVPGSEPVVEGTEACQSTLNALHPGWRHLLRQLHPSRVIQHLASIFIVFMNIANVMSSKLALNITVI